MKNRLKIQRITGLSILIALAIALTFLSNYIPTGLVNINLVLIIIVIAACIYGPLGGMLIGFINGLITIIAPATIAFFIPVSPLGTILVCLLKTTVAGLVSGLVYKLFKNRKFLGSLFASMVVPIINTGLFILGVLVFFMSVYGDVTNLITAVLSLNFLIEFVTIVVLSPTINLIIKVINNKMLENQATSDNEEYETEVIEEERE
ncbi:MAG: ECF transporter S component [Bacilli bacterium]|nr:ECF transporter S component [Bacilli bacterium]